MLRDEGGEGGGREEETDWVETRGSSRSPPEGSALLVPQAVAPQLAVQAHLGGQCQRGASVRGGGGTSQWEKKQKVCVTAIQSRGKASLTSVPSPSLPVADWPRVWSDSLP
jgi:hypothetical protein